MRLCIDMGSQHTKCAIFENQKCLKIFALHELSELKKEITGLSIDKALLVCNDPTKAQEWARAISSWNIPIKSLLCENFSAVDDPALKDLLLPDTIAKIYGALSLYPTNDCIVIDFGTTVRYELITKQGKFLGRTIFPFFELLTRSVHVSTPYIGDEPPSSVGHNLVEAVNSGCYYGLLGSVERIIAELRLQSQTPFEIMTIATGTITEKLGWKNPLTELVDQIHPYLILEGLNQIMNEGT